MNFFERQAQSRRLTRLLIVLFALAVIAVVLAVDVVLLLFLAVDTASSGLNVRALTVTSLGVLAVIGAASWYKTASLAAGGGVVARSLGGVRISPETTDPAQRRLLNVVEEMSIASGVPMPEVFLLEQESSINAFAAGHTPANAAIAVTRGAIEKLKRDELQGVIAHEFSHILNGDMRLNIRLLGLLFGLLVISQMARTVLRETSRDRGRKDGAVVAIVVAAAAIFVIGYVGLFFGRLIQAAVSRARERLADASAVQFTRDTTGLRNALVKIGAVTSTLTHPEVEEVAHMLFAPGLSRFFATHPPLLDRLRALDPRFDPAEIDRMRAQMADEVVVAPKPAPRPAAERLRDIVSVPVTPAAVVDLVANPGAAQIELAHAIRRSLPLELVASSQQPAGATAILLGLALASDPRTRDHQLRFIEHQAGKETAERVRSLNGLLDALEPLQRLPLLTRSLPTLRQLPRAERQHLLAVVHGLIIREGRLSLSIYALRRLAQVHLRDEMSTAPRPGRLSIKAVRNDLAMLLSVLAVEGHADEHSQRAAFEAGMRALGVTATLAVPPGWPASLDLALNRLDLLQPTAKELLVGAMVQTISHDQRLTVQEAELLRAVCASLHCPLPPLVGAVT